MFVKALFRLAVLTQLLRLLCDRIDNAVQFRYEDTAQPLPYHRKNRENTHKIQGNNTEYHIRKVPPDYFLNGICYRGSIPSFVYKNKKSTLRYSFVFGGPEGSRTPVRKPLDMTFSVGSLLFRIPLVCRQQTDFRLG